MNLKIDCGEVSIETAGSLVRVSMVDIDTYDLTAQADEILSEIGNENILEAVDDAEMIEHIGVETISEYIDLDEFFDHNESDLIDLMERRGFKVEKKSEGQANSSSS